MIGDLEWVRSLTGAGTAKVCLVLVLLGLLGCGEVFRKKETPEADLTAVAQNPLTPEETQELLGEVGNNWWYGEGVGDTAATVGTVVLFPPYAALLAGNAALNLTGYESIWLSDLLPEEDREQYRDTYRSITSMPGKANAELAGEEFRNEEEARRRLERFLKKKQETNQKK